jgi:cation diffusion facilitator family transporter
MSGGSVAEKAPAPAGQTAAPKAVYAALVGNAAIAVAKFVAAWFTGSGAMVSEGAHSLVDCANEILLLYGLRRAAKPADLGHPLGHGREVYFWSFIVALMFFVLGACVSFYEGVDHLLHPQPLHNLTVTYGVLAFSIACEATSLRVALKEFAAQKGSLDYLTAVRRSKDPTVFTVLLEDTTAIIGLLLALAGILAADLLGLPQLDGAASIGIALLLGAMAIFLATETKALLIGEQASPDLEAVVFLAAEKDHAVLRANGVFTVHMGPREVVAELSLEFRPEVSAAEVEDAVERIEAHIREQHPEVSMLFIKPQAQARWQARFAEIEAASNPELRARAARRRALRRRLVAR